VRLAVAAAALLLSAGSAAAAGPSLDGTGNNRAHPDWGRAGTPYPRVAAADYANGARSMRPGPNARRISNRVFNDLSQNVFSPRRDSQWVWTWAQFVDHTIEQARTGGPRAPIAFDGRDPLERFRDDLGTIAFTRDAAAAGTGIRGGGPRQQVNATSSFIDGSAVYGDSPARLAWLRSGPGLLLDPGGYLPRASARGDPATAPAMELGGALATRPADAVVAGDPRANQNVALLGLQTLFAREHNRVVAALPPSLGAARRFAIARRVVAAEQQYVTYREFLPAVGVRLPRYRGYRPAVDPAVTNEFASVGFRMHSMVHADFQIRVGATHYAPERRAALERKGVRFEPDPAGPTRIAVAVPLNVAFFDPDLLPQLGLGELLSAMTEESQYSDDELIDDLLRSVLFSFPGPGAADPAACFEDATRPGCYSGVTDLAAIDVQRGRDHGIPAYNALRRAYGLAPRRSFAALTGEPAQTFPPDPLLDLAHPEDDPDGLAFTAIHDERGARLDPTTKAGRSTAVRAVRRTPLAARLRALYGSVDRVDAFVGALSEARVPGSDLGELQLAMWRRQFAALRDGDRFFYARDPELRDIARRYGITYRHTLSELIALDAGQPRGPLPADVFRAPPR
jgi:hypothetical protein